MIEGLPKEDCIQGIDPYISREKGYKLSAKRYLEAFNRGPCSPIITIPGITGSKLVAEVDCEVLKRESPKVFKSCGWSTCKKKSFFGKSPKTEYNVWVPELGKPFNVLGTIFGSKMTCFSYFISLVPKTDS